MDVFLYMSKDHIKILCLCSIVCHISQVNHAFVTSKKHLEGFQYTRDSWIIGSTVSHCLKPLEKV